MDLAGGCDRARRRALLGLRGLRARDREAGQPDPETAQAGRPVAEDRLTSTNVQVT